MTSVIKIMLTDLTNLNTVTAEMNGNQKPKK